MKFLALALTLFALSFSDSVAMGMKSFGGVMFSETPSGDWFKIKSARLNVAVICESFGVSPNDYRLHYQSQFGSSPNFLELRPHISDSGLPIIPVLLRAGDAHVLRNSGRAMLEVPIVAPPDAPASFNGFRGTARGRVSASTPGGGISGAVDYEVTGSSTTHIFKFRFKTVNYAIPGQG